MTELRKSGRSTSRSIWQRNYHNHIIRDDVDRFFIEQYIELNPIVWDVDTDNPASGEKSIDQLRAKLQERHGLTGLALERVIDYELNYRDWQKPLSSNQPLHPPTTGGTL